jgi:hypothetical protein
VEKGVLIRSDSTKLHYYCSQQCCTNDIALNLSSDCIKNLRHLESCSLFQL